MSFLGGRYIPKFDPSKEKLPTKEELEYYLYTHDIQQNVSPCTLKENRYSIDNFYDKEDDKTYKEIYCWKGIIHQRPECTIGTVCDPNSYAGARSRFCLTWGCPEAFLYVGDAAGQAIVNERGGVVVFNQKEKCEGAFINKMNCFIGGIRQSMDNLLDPANRKELMLKMSILTVVFIVAMIGLLRLRQSKSRTLKHFRGAFALKFKKTQPIFPKYRTRK